MSLDLKKFFESGLLELYVLDKLSKEEIKTVEEYISAFPQLKTEMFEIERTLYRYDTLFDIEPPKNVLDKVLNKIGETTSSSSNTTKDKNSKIWRNIAFLTSVIGLLVSLIFINSNRKKQHQIDEQIKLIEDCENEKSNSQETQNLYADLISTDYTKVILATSDKYPDSKLSFFTNPIEEKNFIKINQLPELTNNLSFQLWSLKGDNAPIPLDVFNDSTEIIPVRYINDTDAYAITIEPSGGSLEPTLSELIGVFSVKG